MAEVETASASRIVLGLRESRFDATLVTTGAQAVNHSELGGFELLVLDLALTAIAGESVLERVRASSAMPVIVLSANTTLADRLCSFELGATDYMARPFWVEELVARVRVHLPRGPRILAFDDVVVDLDRRSVNVAGGDARFTPLELQLLVALLDHPKGARSRAELAKTLSVSNVSERTVDSHIARLRKKLGAAGLRIVTVWGHGYRFDGSLRS